MADKFVEQNAREGAEALWSGVEILISSGMEPKQAFMECAPAFLLSVYERLGFYITEANRFRNQAHCTHESAEPMSDSRDDETTYLCPDCEYTWSESE